jgi:hypothetical protein
MKTLMLFLALALVVPSQVLACSCMEPKVQEVLKWADVVFTGEATKVQYVDAQGDKMFGERRIIVTFTVSGYWKGNVQKTITLHTVYNRVSCGGYFFKEGEKFIVYAKETVAKDWLEGEERRPTLQGVALLKPNDRILGTGLCTRTSHLENAEKDLKELGKPKVP